MSVRTRLVLFAGLWTVAAGCSTTISGSLWLPAFASKQQSEGGDVLDLDNQLGVVSDEQVLVYDLAGETKSGRNRVRITYWRIHGEGQGTPDAFNFAGEPYPGGNLVDTIMDLDSMEVLWEPALIKADGFRLRLIAGAILLRFHMSVDDPGAGLSNVLDVPGEEGPLSGMGVDFIAAPVAGAGFEAALAPWLKLVARGQMFDTQYLAVSKDFEGAFVTAVGGVLIGKPRGLRLLVGFRHFHAEYAYDTDSGDTTFNGPIAELSLRIAF